MQNKVTYLYIPWYNEDALQHSCMVLSTVGKPNRRMAFRLIRNWYKKQLGRAVHKELLTRIWNARIETNKFDAEKYMHELARETYEQTKEITDTEVQEGTAGEAG